MTKKQIEDSYGWSCYKKGKQDEQKRILRLFDKLTDKFWNNTRPHIYIKDLEKLKKKIKEGGK